MVQHELSGSAIYVDSENGFRPERIKAIAGEDKSREARMSFSVIGAILKKATEENETSKEQTEMMSQAAKAYKLFSDGKSPVDVAITLNLRQAEVTEFYREYWKLKQLYDLSRVYEEIKGDIHSFVNLYRLIK